MRTPLMAVLTVSLFAISSSDAQTRLRLASTDIRSGARIANPYAFNAMGCTGKNVSPELHWDGAPAKTKSFALTMYDPDAPTGSGWWHWVVYNIPAGSAGFATGAGEAGKNLLPAGSTVGNGDAGMAAYQGPCPAKGDKPHHYVFSLYALDTDRLDVPAGASAAYVGYNIHMHQLARTTLTAIYSR